MFEFEWKRVEPNKVMSNSANALESAQPLGTRRRAEGRSAVVLAFIEADSTSELSRNHMFLKQIFSFE